MYKDQHCILSWRGLPVVSDNIMMQTMQELLPRDAFGAYASDCLGAELPWELVVELLIIILRGNFGNFYDQQT
jgi:hypothetical protein